MSCSDTELEKAEWAFSPDSKQQGGAIMARRKKKDQEGPVETRENDRAAEIEYRVMLARNLERNFGFGF